MYSTMGPFRKEFPALLITIIFDRPYLTAASRVGFS
jgi:hypothetical protein